MHGAYEGSIDLDLIKMKSAELAEGCIARAEIVKDEASAEGLDRRQCVRDRAGVAQQQAFGYFDFQPSRRQSRQGECPGHVLCEITGFDLQRRRVDGDGDLVWPMCSFTAGFLQNPVANLFDKADLFCQRYEMRRLPGR
jgi:hypothetical protein